MWRLWRRFLASTRASDSAICEMSQGRGLFDDFHDYHDADPALPLHFHIHSCRRCQKQFCI